MPYYTLTENAVFELRQLRQRVEELEAQLGMARRAPLYMRQHLAYVGGTAITARSGTTPGSGTVTLKHRNSSGAIADIEDGSGTAITKTAYNWTDDVSGTNAYVWVGQDSLGTIWYLNEDC